MKKQQKFEIKFVQIHGKPFREFVSQMLTPSVLQASVNVTGIYLFCQFALWDSLVVQVCMTWQLYYISPGVLEDTIRR